MNTADDTTPAATDTAADTDEDGAQVLLVRRRRTPALGFWVLLALAVAFLGGTVVAWLAEVRAPAGMLYFGVTAAVMVGLPLAALAALVDAIADRRRRRRATGIGTAGRGADHDRAPGSES